MKESSSDDFRAFIFTLTPGLLVAIFWIVTLASCWIGLTNFMEKVRLMLGEETPGATLEARLYTFSGLVLFIFVIPAVTRVICETISLSLALLTDIRNNTSAGDLPSKWIEP